MPWILHDSWHLNEILSEFTVFLLGNLDIYIFWTMPFQCENSCMDCDLFMLKMKRDENKTHLIYLSLFYFHERKKKDEQTEKNMLWKP